MNTNNGAGPHQPATEIPSTLTESVVPAGAKKPLTRAEIEAAAAQMDAEDMSAAAQDIEAICKRRNVELVSRFTFMGGEIVDDRPALRRPKKR